MEAVLTETSARYGAPLRSQEIPSFDWQSLAGPTSGFSAGGGKQRLDAIHCVPSQREDACRRVDWEGR